MKLTLQLRKVCYREIGSLTETICLSIFLVVGICGPALYLKPKNEILKLSSSGGEKFYTRYAKRS